MRGWHTIDNGWLLPDGRFVACRSYGHIEVVIELAGTPGAREPPGWIKLADGRWIPSSIELSQAQIDFVWDWLQGRAEALPVWFEVVLGRGRAPNGLS